MRPWQRWIVTVVLAVDALCAFAFLSSAVLETKAAPAQAAVQPLKVEEPARATALQAADPAAAPAASAAALVKTAAAPAARVTPAAQAGAPDPAGTAADTIPGAGPDEPATPRQIDNASKSEAFQRLLRAYENMEPESAAKALAELASRDRQAVVELVLRGKPRTSGAILDALTQTHPGLAADLSDEIWRRAQATPAPKP